MERDGGGKVKSSAKTFGTKAEHGNGGFCDQQFRETEPSESGHRNKRANAKVSGGGGGGWAKMNEDMARNRAKLQATALPGLTWVGGDRAPEDLDETSRKILAASSSGTSIFDPVLCELAYRWFCPPGGLVLDPFAGGSVRGIVAAKCGREYIGIDLRPEQVEANRAQASAICGDGIDPAWIIGDSAMVVQGLDCAADFVFSCPPYGDLEVYSERLEDLSNMGRAGFSAAYRKIIVAAIGKLKADRFACFVVGDYRDRAGFYCNFVSETIAAFEAAGTRLYNEAILVTAAGSLPIRAGRQFVVSRKLGKTHQNVLVFVKGDPKRATAACGPVEIDDGLFAEALDG